MTCHITACLLFRLLDQSRLHLVSLNLGVLLCGLPPSFSEIWLAFGRKRCLENSKGAMAPRGRGAEYWQPQDEYMHVPNQKILSEGVQLWRVFWLILVDERREDPNTNKSGPSSARQWNAISMAFRWRADDGISMAYRWRAVDGPIRIAFPWWSHSGLTLNAGLVAFRFSGDSDQYC